MEMLCPYCGETVDVPDTIENDRRVRCPYCDQKFVNNGGIGEVLPYSNGEETTKAVPVEETNTRQPDVQIRHTKEKVSFGMSVAKAIRILMIVVVIMLVRKYAPPVISSILGKDAPASVDVQANRFVNEFEQAILAYNIKMAQFAGENITINSLLQEVLEAKTKDQKLACSSKATRIVDELKAYRGVFAALNPAKEVESYVQKKTDADLTGLKDLQIESIDALIDAFTDIHKYMLASIVVSGQASKSHELRLLNQCGFSRSSATAFVVGEGFVNKFEADYARVEKAESEIRSRFVDFNNRSK